MRTLVAVVLLAALSVAGLAQEKPPTKKEAADLVAEYVKSDTDDTRRAAILKRLQAGNAGLAANPLKDAAGNEETVGHALNLAMELRVGGLYATAKKHLEGDYEDVILRYGMVLGEKGVEDLVWERWKAKDATGTSFNIAHGLLTELPVSLPTIVKVKGFLDDVPEDDPKYDGAAQILRVQLGLGNATADQIHREWKTFLSEFEAASRVFPMAGKNLLNAEGIETTGSVIKVGPNRRLAPNSSLTIPAGEDWQKSSFTIALRIRVSTEGSASVHLSSAQGSWAPEYGKGEWVLRTGNQEQLVVPGKLGEWVEIRFETTVEKASSTGGVEVRGGRNVKITVAGKVVMQSGTLNGEMNHLQIRTGADAVCVVGCVEKIGR